MLSQFEKVDAAELGAAATAQGLKHVKDIRIDAETHFRKENIFDEETARNTLIGVSVYLFLLNFFFIYFHFELYFNQTVMISLFF